MKRGYTQTIWGIISISELISVILIIFGAYLVTNEKVFGWSGILLGTAFLILLVFISGSRRKASENFLKQITHELRSKGGSVLENLPVAAAIMHSDGAVRWCNEKFTELVGENEVIDHSFEKLIPQIKWNYVLKNASNMRVRVKIGNGVFEACGTLIKNMPSDDDKYSIYIYFLDKTDENKIAEAYKNERTDMAVINLDNYDELLQRLNDNEEQTVISLIRKYVSEWATEGNAIVKHIDDDRYIMLFEHKYLDGYMKKKFNVVDKIRTIADEVKAPVSISIGIGVGGNLNANEAAARNALEMALGRGGDQVCIKDDTQYRFFGGKSKEYEKSTRVKTRAVALALKDFIKQSDKVIFTGHKGADYDCFGAAMGLQRAVRVYGKQPYIIYDNNSPAIDRLFALVKKEDEYGGMFISPEDVRKFVTKDTLVVVLDTHRPSMVAASELLQLAQKIVLIDHHRRSTDFINPCSLVYHEPYASSVCEMATELVEYMDVGSNLTRLEAESLYTGILMDTKNFIVKTGVRTFDAASYLKRLGINTMEIKKFFNTTKIEYDEKVDIVKTAEKIGPNMAVARTYDMYSNMRVIASQAADEMLNIGDVMASFVVYPTEGGAGICARSLGTVNVQLIMEEIGGGGHMTIAGAQLKNETIDGAVKRIRAAVKKYMDSNE